MRKIVFKIMKKGTVDLVVTVLGRLWSNHLEAMKYAIEEGK